MPSIRTALATAGVFALATSAMTSAAEVTGLPGTSIDGTRSLAVDLGSSPNGNLVTEPTTVYSNINAETINSAFASSDLGATFGDDLEIVDTGLLSEITFGIANFASNGANLDTFDIALDFFTYATPTSDPVYAGTATGSFDFTNDGTEAGLAPNNAGVATLTGLESEGIILNSTDVVVLQTASNVTGGTNGIGVFSLTPIEIGDAIPQLYIEASDVNGGTAGFYNIVDGNQQPVDFFVSYDLVVTAIPEPGTASLLGLGAAGLLIRRRRA